MSISSIQAPNNDYYSTTKKVNQSGENAPSQSRGVDTISFSDEARSKANSNSEQIADKTKGKGPDSTINMLALMMESLLMAMLGENEDNAPKPSNNANSDQGSEQNNTQQSDESQKPKMNNSGQDKPSGVADSDAVKGIKNAISDYMLGGGGLDAVSSAMNSASTTTSTTNASTNFSKDNESKK